MRYARMLKQRLICNTILPQTLLFSCLHLVTPLGLLRPKKSKWSPYQTQNLLKKRAKVALRSCLPGNPVPSPESKTRSVIGVKVQCMYLFKHNLKLNGFALNCAFLSYPAVPFTSFAISFNTNRWRYRA